MSDERTDELRQRLTVDVPPPPAGLAERIKAEIPADLKQKVEKSQGASLNDHPAAWRLAASVLMIFGFTYIAARTYLASRSERAIVTVQESAPAIARSASEERLPAQAIEAGGSGDADMQAAAPPPPPMADRPLPAAPRTKSLAVAEAPSRHASNAALRERDYSPEPASPDLAAAQRSEVKSDHDAAQIAADRTDDRAGAVAMAPAPPPPASVAEAPAESSARSVMQKSAAKTEAATTAHATTPAIIERKPFVLGEKDAATRGEVHARVTVDANGRVRDVRVIAGVSRTVDRAVIESLTKWRFDVTSSRTFDVRICIGIEREYCI